MILLTEKKHKNIIVFFVLLLFLIFLCVLWRQVSAVNNLQNALKSAEINIEKLFEDFLISGGMRNSFTIKYESFNDSYLESVTLSNSKENSYMYLGLRGKINVDAFSHKNKLGFYLPENPEICYTVSSKNLSLKWNSSVYGKIVKIPDFVPNNLNYKKINSLLNCKKLFETSLVLGLGKERMNTNELTKNMSVSKMDTYPMIKNGIKKNTSVVRVTIPKKNIINFISYNFSLTDRKYKGYAVEYINKLKKYLESVDNTELNADFFLCNQKLIQARLCIGSKLIVFNNGKTGIEFYVKETISKKVAVGVKIDKPVPNMLIANITLGKNYIIKAQKKEKNIINIEAGEENCKYPEHKLTYRPWNSEQNINYTEKNVYDISLYELMCITENIMKKSSL